MKLLSNRSRKNRIIKMLREQLNSLRRDLNWMTNINNRAEDLNRKLFDQAASLSKENKELLDYKAKYYNIVKNMKA